MLVAQRRQRGQFPAGLALPQPALADQFAYLRQSNLQGLLLDELVTQTYELQDVERAFQDLQDGKLARGVLRIQ